jgi:ribosomal protein S21
MALEIKKKQRENVQAMMRRFQKAVQQSGILLEVRKRQFVKRVKSNNMQKKTALRKVENRKKYEIIKKMKRA